NRAWYCSSSPPRKVFEKGISSRAADWVKKVTTSRDRPAGPKVRADLLLLEQGHATSRAHAQALILAGDVFVGDDRVEKPGQLLRRETPLRVRERQGYVSRGGPTLEGALDGVALDPAGVVCVGVGAASGGRTACLLQPRPPPV